MEPSNSQAITAGLRRDNESMDDFEHLEAESTSPVKDNPNDELSSKESKADINKCDNELLSSSPIVKAGESQQSPDFSLLSDSKENAPVECISAALEKPPASLLEAAALVDANMMFDNIEFSSDPKTTSQSFLESEMSSEPPVSNVPLGIPHDVDFLKFDPNPLNEAGKAVDDIKNVFKESVVTTDEDNTSATFTKFTLPEEKLTVFQPEDIKQNNERGMGDVVKSDQVEFVPVDKPSEIPPDNSLLSKLKSDHDEEEEEYNLAASQDSSPIRMADKLEQYHIKPPLDVSPKTEQPILTETEEAIADETELIGGLAPSAKEEVAVEEPKLPARPDPTPKPATTVAVGPAVELPFDSWFKPERLHPKVESLVYWRNPKVSGAVLGAGLALLLSLSYCSLISVIAYVSLAVLIGSGGFRLYRAVLAAVNKTGEGHPFRDLLDKDITVSPDRAASVTQQIIPHINAHVSELRRLFLVEDILDSIKFGVLLWVLTYVGAIFNGLTLIILGFVSAFTLPRLYENNKQQIDKNVDVVRAKIAEITAKVQAFNPLAGAAAKKSSEEKKEN